MEHEYIKQILDRTDIQHISEFLVSGIELGDPPSKKSYKERLNEGSLNIERWLRINAKDEDDRDKVFFDFGIATDTYREVFLEIGMKVGARLMLQLLCDND